MAAASATASVKSNKAELEQVALAMMMMAGGEGTSSSSTSSPVKDEGRRTRSTRSSTGRTPPAPALPLPNLRRRSIQIQKVQVQDPEPVSGNNNCLNRKKRNPGHNNQHQPPQEQHQQLLRSPMPPMSLKKEKERERVVQVKFKPGEEEVEDGDNDDYDYDHRNGNGMEVDQSHDMIEISATDLVKCEDELPEEEDEDESIVCAINPMVMLGPGLGPDEDDHDQEDPHSPESHQSTNSNSGSGGGGGSVQAQASGDHDGIYMSSSRRFFRPEFKEKVLRAFQSDPECVGNQRATARKFGIHRRQVQKWLQQFNTGGLSIKVENSQSELLDEQNQEDSSHLDGIGIGLELTSNKPEPRLQSAGRNRKKVLTRSSLGNNKVNNNQNRLSDPQPITPPRLLRLSSRPRGKSMPLKGGSKSTFVPTIVHPTSLNLSTKGSLKQNGRTSASSTATSNYFNENGNGSVGSSANGNNMFMNMSTLLASAAAAGNLGMPLSLDNHNPRTFSPRDHSPLGNNGRGSPAHSAGGSSGSGNSNLQNALLLVDELNYLYPHSDFSLLRKALLKEEVSLEKLAQPLIRSKFAEFRMNGNGLNLNLNSEGLRDLRRAANAVSPSPGKSSSSQSEYNTQQTIDIIRQQQQYLKWLGQTCGISSNSSELSGLNLADINTNGGGGGVPSWFNPFAAAAAAGLPIASTSTSGIRGDNGRRKENNDNHRFASPRAPPAVNSGKAKTVAAALAATRVQSTNSPQHIKNYSMNQMERGGGGGNGRQSQNSRQAAQRRKPKPRPRNTSMGEEDIDPTSMLEVVTSIPSPSISPRKNQYNYNGHHHHRNNGNGNGNGDYNQHGMDLTTTSASANTTTTSTTSTPSRLISKAMNKEYSFFDVLGLVRKNPEDAAETSTSSNGNGTASLENFVQNMLPSEREKSPPKASSTSTSSSSPPASDLSDSDKTKNMVIEAFSLDPEISGDPRAVARKFGLNVRVVMKWLKEGPVKMSNSNDQGYHENGTITSDNNNLPRVPRMMNGNGGGGRSEEEEYIRSHSHKESNNNSPGSIGGGTTGVNKRKNSKPNQICDFPTDDVHDHDEAGLGLNGALDMVVPIKKRRVSSPSPAPQDA